MHFALADEIQQVRILAQLGARSSRQGSPRRHPRVSVPPIRSTVERLRLAVAPVVHDHRATIADRESLAASTELEAELAHERDRLHELRATVSGLVASHQLLQGHQAELTAATRSRLEQLHGAELGRLERLLVDRSAGPAEPIDLGAVIDTLVETLRLRGHEIAWTGTTAHAWGCPDDVAQVLHVLLENAIRHAFGSEVEVAVSPHGRTVEIRVRDRGPGVAPEVLQDLFRRGACRTDSPGEGIGLSIARRLADQMGAVLRLEPQDADRTGSTFVLSLPATSDRASCDGELG